MKVYSLPHPGRFTAPAVGKSIRMSGKAAPVVSAPEKTSPRSAGLLQKTILLLGLLPGAVALPRPLLAQEPASIQVATATDSPERLSALAKLAAEQKTLLEGLSSRQADQAKALEVMQKKLAILSNETQYEAFAKGKLEAIQRVQAAQFILNDRMEGTTPEGNKYFAIGSTAGWVAKDKDGKVFLLGCAHGVRESYEKNPKVEFEVLLGAEQFKTTLTKNLPAGLKPYSEALDICYLDIPEDPALKEKLSKLAIPVADLITRKLTPGTEALAIGSPLDTIRYVTEGIISEHDQNGRRKNGGVTSSFPTIFTDSGTNSGNSGGPLIAFNWDTDTWEVVASTVAKDPTSFHYAICTPMEAFQAFLHQRGLHTLDRTSPQALERAEQIVDVDQGYPLKQRKIIDKFLEPVFSDLKTELEPWLKKNNLTRAQYLQTLQKRFAKLAELPQYKDKLMLPYLDPGVLNFGNEALLQEMVKKAVMNQSS